MPAPNIPPPPLPRADLHPPNGETPEDYQEYVTFLADAPVDAWRDQDGMIYVFRMSAAMAPSIGMVDSSAAVAPGDPSYNEWSAQLEPEYDFMVPTKVTPAPRPSRQSTQSQQQTKEVPGATSADHDAEAG